MMFRHTPEEARNLVADALESGEYEQIVGWLTLSHGHCCLGVACEVFMEVETDNFLEKTEGLRGTSQYAGSSSVLPIKVQNWLGFNSSDGEWKEEDDDAEDIIHDSLVARNDSGTPFEEIAKLFRDPPEGLLKE